MMADLPALQVVVPLLCAPVCVLLRGRAAAWWVFLAAALGSLACSVLLAVRVYSTGPWAYSMGGWGRRKPYPGTPEHVGGDTFSPGIELVIDGANVPVLLLLSVVAVVTAVYGRRSIEAEIERRRIYLFYAVLCLCLTGLLGITATGDAFNLFVFLEISSLSSYTLIAMGRHRRAMMAAFQYLVMGTIGGTFLLIGVGLLYAKTGTLNMADLAGLVDRLPAGDRAVAAAAVFIIVGLGIKAALFPLHAWLPGAYAEAPSAVTVFLAATGTKVALYALARFIFTVFGAEWIFGNLSLGGPGLLIGCLGMLAGSAVACFQNDFKRLLAWSSIGQIGYIVAGFSLATPDGVRAAYLHIINHAVIKAALFGVAGILLVRLGATTLSAMSGLGRRMPVTFAAIVLAGLGLVGVPLTAGFVSKWALAVALVEQGQWLVLAVVLVSSLLALVYIGRVVEIAWFRPVPDEPPPPRETVCDSPEGGPVQTATKVKKKARRKIIIKVVALTRTPATMAGATGFLVLLSVYLGVDATWPAALAEGAADALLGGGR